MTGLLASRAARRRSIVYIALLVIALLLMAFSTAAPLIELQRGVGFAFRPIQSALTGVARGAASLVEAVGEIDVLRRENAALEQENQRLTAENAGMAEIRRENEQLTALLQLRSGLEYETVAAEIIGRDSSEFRRAVSIDSGTDDGVAVGDVVIAAGGALVGRIVEAGSNYSNVMLINDTSSTVIGQDVANAATGEVIGALTASLVMQNVDSTVRLQLGEEVVTAGIELASGVRSPFPKGLLIGQVIDVSRNANDVTQTAFLQPAADLEKLEYVLVITTYEGGLPAVGDQPTEETNPDGTLPDTEQPLVSPAPSAAASESPAP